MKYLALNNSGGNFATDFHWSWSTSRLSGGRRSNSGCCGRSGGRCLGGAGCQEFLMLLLIHCQLFGDHFVAFQFRLERFVANHFLVQRHQLLLAQFNGFFDSCNAHICNGRQLLNRMTFQIDLGQSWCRGGGAWLRISHIDCIILSIDCLQ